MAALRFGTPVPGAHHFFSGPLVGETAPVVRQVQVALEPRSSYEISADVTGAPIVYVDLMAPGTAYDTLDQEMAVEGGPSRRQRTRVVDSGDVPAVPTFFRVFSVSQTPVDVHSVGLVKLSSWAFSLAHGAGLVLLLVGLFLFLEGLAAPTHRVLFALVLAGSLVAFGVSLSGHSRPIHSGDVGPLVAPGSVRGGVSSSVAWLLAPAVTVAGLVANTLALHERFPGRDGGWTSLRFILFGVTLALFFGVVFTLTGHRYGPALVLTGGLVACTPLLRGAVGPLESTALVLPCLLAATLLLLKGGQVPSVWVGLLLALACGVNLGALGAVAAVTAWARRHRRQDLPSLAAGLAGGALTVVLGEFILGGLDRMPGAMGPGATDWLSSCAALVVSPNRGLLFSCPWVVVPIFTLWTFRHSLIAERPELLLVVMLAVGMLFGSGMRTQGHSYGSSDALEAAVFLLALLVTVEQQVMVGGVMRNLLVAGAVGAFVVTLGGFTRGAEEWNDAQLGTQPSHARAWDLTDWQIGRAFAGALR